MTEFDQMVLDTVRRFWPELATPIEDRLRAVENRVDCIRERVEAIDDQVGILDRRTDGVL